MYVLYLILNPKYMKITQQNSPVVTFYHCDSIAMHPYLATNVPKRSEEPSGSFLIHETHYFVSLAEQWRRRAFRRPLRRWCSRLPESYGHIRTCSCSSRSGQHA